jgi:hypothetical protein
MQYGNGLIHTHKQRAAKLYPESVAETQLSECLMPGTTQDHDLFRREL